MSTITEKLKNDFLKKHKGENHKPLPLINTDIKVLTNQWLRRVVPRKNIQEKSQKNPIPRSWVGRLQMGLGHFY